MFRAKTLEIGVVGFSDSDLLSQGERELRRRFTRVTGPSRSFVPCSSVRQLIIHFRRIVMLNLRSRIDLKKIASLTPSLTPSLKTIDERVSQVLTHPTFLRSASLVINMNSYRRKWTRAAVRSALVSLEIPVRTDQERMLALLEQLNSRLQDLEDSRNSESSPSPANTESTVNRAAQGTPTATAKKTKSRVNHANH